VTRTFSLTAAPVDEHEAQAKGGGPKIKIATMRQSATDARGRYVPIHSEKHQPRL
jgi:hypothetical protein